MALPVPQARAIPSPKKPDVSHRQKGQEKIQKIMRKRVQRPVPSASRSFVQVAVFGRLASGQSQGDLSHSQKIAHLFVKNKSTPPPKHSPIEQKAKNSIKVGDVGVGKPPHARETDRQYRELHNRPPLFTCSECGIDCSTEAEWRLHHLSPYHRGAVDIERLREPMEDEHIHEGGVFKRLVITRKPEDETLEELHGPLDTLLPLFECRFCKEPFVRKEELMEHEAVFHKHLWRCTMMVKDKDGWHPCGEGFPSITKLSAHFRTGHPYQIDSP